MHPDISEEFELANHEVRVGRGRNEALRNLVVRTGVDDLRSLVAVIPPRSLQDIQSDDLTEVLSRRARVY